MKKMTNKLRRPKNVFVAQKIKEAELRCLQLREESDCLFAARCAASRALYAESSRIKMLFDPDDRRLRQSFIEGVVAATASYHALDSAHRDAFNASCEAWGKVREAEKEAAFWRSLLLKSPSTPTP